MEWEIIGYTVFAGLAGWLLYRTIKHNPESFSAENLKKSTLTLGYLALFLIGFIVMCIWLLRQS